MIAAFLIFYRCDEIPFVGANISYSKSMEQNPGYNYSDLDFDLAHFSQDNLDHDCIGTLDDLVRDYPQ